MTREIKTDVLDGACRHYAAAFLNEDVRKGNRYIGGPSYVMQDFFSFVYRDEFDYMVKSMKEWMGPSARKEFQRRADHTFMPRSEETLEKELRKRLAIDMDGAHIPGAIGTVQVGSRRVGSHFVDVETRDSIRKRRRFGLPKSYRDTDAIQTHLDWPIYAGEEEERAANSGVADPLPQEHRAVGALNTRIANAAAIAACDAIVDLLDLGTSGPVIKGYTTAQATDPDTAIGAQTLLFTLVGGDPAFGAAADAAPGGIATANAITDDTSADATDTLAWCRAASSNDGAAILTAYIDGEAGTSGADFNFNTLSIVTGATISMSSWTVTMPES